MSYRISFDMDGVYVKYPEFFEMLRTILKHAGHEVGVLSGRGEQDIPGGPWDFIYGGKNREIEQYPPFDTDEARCHGKGELMRKYKIDIHFDDMADHFDKDLTVIKIQ